MSNYLAALNLVGITLNYMFYGCIALETFVVPPNFGTVTTPATSSQWNKCLCCYKGPLSRLVRAN